MITVKAYGKINLTLDVLNKLPDGYHQVEMVMQQIQLHDLVKIKELEEDKIVITSNMKGVPLNESNLAFKAAKLIKDIVGIKRGVHIHLEKRLPMEAGLAGGSSNGAATLKGINELFDLKLSLQQLMELA
ncbi:MAG: 4-(cytidine 5'-diphospho)-2-C-methyl-D-erythritol kinase, partial [Bacillota bacterium]|nr:4-(cytidine 5'-diphospho)-2-C-methyl-D-erythritol kinase [Bacillota bacterium]